jgi:hypothetical protein
MSSLAIVTRGSWWHGAQFCVKEAAPPAGIDDRARAWERTLRSSHGKETIMRPIRNGLLAVALACAVAVLGPAHHASSADEDATAPVGLQHVELYDGDAWKTVDLGTGSVEGPGGGGTPKARLESQLGGPRTFFIVAGPASETSVSVARPRFRVQADGAVARRIQLAPFDVKDENRRTPIEIRKGVTLFLKGVDVEATKVRDGLWEIRPKKSLQPGEYLLALSEAGPVATFAIEAHGY